MDPQRFGNSMNAMFGSGGMQHSEVISVPDKMVGLIIGKGGEQIANIQTESECKIQFAPATGCGMPDRQCTLTGTVEAIQKAQEFISRIMNKGHDLPNVQSDGHITIEMMIPGNKAGIIIGKGGETIKQLQERGGVRMVIIQESNSPTNYEKPLRITGDRISCQKARDMVLELLAEKDIQTGGGYGEISGLGQRSNIEILVPRSMIGVVIGKGGDMIKKIQQESGARIQFRPEDEQGGPNRMCNLSGTTEQTQTAGNMIQELIDSTAQRQGMIGGGGQGQGWPRTSEPRLDSVFDGRGRFGNGCDLDEMTYAVPAEKCGLVIGKGGDTIRDICRQSGAHVELNRDQSINSLERVFRITGSAEQMHAAIRLISEKAGIALPHDGLNSRSAPLPSTGLANNSNLYGLPEVSHQQQQQQQPIQQIVQNFTVPSWGATTQYQQYTQQNIVDPSGKQAIDAAWTTYYSPQVQSQAPAPVPAVQQFGYQPTALTQQNLQSIPTQQTSPFISRTPVTPQPTINPSTGQLDYSAAWAEYYRQQGMPQHAQAILQAAQHVTQHPQ